MCIIISKPEGFTIDEETITTCWEANSDGAGFMYAKDDKLFVEKGFMKLQDFKDAYEKVGHLPSVLHFRIKTHGAVDEENTHPFVVHGSLAFAHNGVISHIDTPDHSKSDTWHFNENLIKPLCASDFNFLDKQWNQQLISGYIGMSKLAFLDNYGKITIINQDKGVWDDGVWFSNTSYKRKKVSGTPFQKEYPKPRLVPNFDSVFLKNDLVKVVVNKTANKAIKAGDNGIVEAVYPGGYVKVIFHEWGNGVATERSILMHENDLTFAGWGGYGNV